MSHVRTAEKAMASRGSSFRLSRISMRRADSFRGVTISRIMESERSMRPKPISALPRVLVLARSWVRRIEPAIIRAGESRLKSKISTWATIVVLKSAPIIIAMAAVRLMLAFLTKEVVMSAVAVELCSSAVMLKPVANARKRLRVELLRIARIVPPKLLVMLVVTNFVLQRRRATAAARWMRVMVIPRFYVKMRFGYRWEFLL